MWIGVLEMKEQITLEIARKMHILYAAGVTREEIGTRFGFKANSVYCSFRRHGLPTRTPAEAGPIQAIKRSGNFHWRRRSPQSIKLKQYRSMRVRDEDGLIHKRRVHVILMEQHIGRRLKAEECVHHINGNRHDNRLENLQLMTRREHGRLEAKLARSRYPEKFRRKRENGRFAKEYSE